MSLSEEIKNSIIEKSLTPSKEDVKSMLRNKQFNKLAGLFNFEPKFFTLKDSEEKLFDWKSAPVSMLRVLERKKLPFIHRDRADKQNKDFFHKNQNGICYYCKKYIPINKFTIDHRTPLSRGGKNWIENMIGACSTCNNEKGCLTEEEYFNCEKKDLKAYLFKVRFERGLFN